MVRNRVSVGLSVLSAVALLSPAMARGLDQPRARPNIVLCMADDQGWGDVGYYGHSPVQTPVLDEMAASALRFDRFYAAAPVCSPTRGSVLTGRHPNRFGCFSWGHALRPQEITIAEAVKTAGYATGHFGKWHLGSVHAASPVCPGRSGFDQWLSSPNFYENNPLMSHNGKVVQTQGESSMVAVEAALEFIRRATASETPFLAVVWFGNPHSPHVAVDELRQLYPDQPERLQNFYGEITGIDRAMGRLREALRELGIAEDTLLWYTSDNGALQVGSTGGLSGRKGGLEEGGIRVPAIIEWPARIAKPQICAAACGTVDIYPTLLDVLGIQVPGQPRLDGESLVRVIDGAADFQRTGALGFWVHPTRGIPQRSTEILKAMRDEQASSGTAESQADPGQITTQFPEDEFPGNAAWIDGDFKLHRRVAKSSEATYALYHLGSDIREEQDIAAEHAARVARMKAELAAWQQSVVRSLNGADYVQR